MEDKAGEPAVIEESNAPRFSAFISYSHADAAKVRKLHSQIEAYRLPKDIGSIDTLNHKRRGLGKIFRDREDLSAAEDLSKAVKDALNSSQVLVVACSPDARASQWVDQEIAYFRERHPDRPILAAILRGEPSEAFPAALTDGGAEPLAADLRKQGDGWKLGFLKVVAGIAGVPLDRLVQRDSQRQLRRVTAVTGLVAAIAIAMGVMTTIALQARNEAEAQRAEAEELIEYMLTDLRDELEGVGRIDIMEGVNSTALDFYRAPVNTSGLSDKSLLNRARVIEASGVDREKREEYAEALEKFKELHAVTQEILSRDPDNPEKKLIHAWSETRLITAKGSELSQSEMVLWTDRVLSTLSETKQWGWNRPDWLELEILANSNKCTVAAFDLNIDPETETYCQRSVAAGPVYDSLDQGENPKYITAYAHFWYAYWLYKNGRQSEAHAQFEAALRLSTDLLEVNPEDAQHLNQRMEFLGSDLREGHPNREEELREAMYIALHLMKENPNNLEVKSRCISIEKKMGVVNVKCI